jgi:LemA protein
MIVIFVLIALIVLIVLFGISQYNGLIKKRNMMQEGWSGIDVLLKKRYDLVPNLVNTVKGYATHEKQLLEQVTALRTQAMQSSNIDQKIGAEKELSQALGKLVVSVENYPDLKANENFRDLQAQLTTIESELEMARRYYNGTVRENNIAVETFPSNIVAGSFKFEKGTFFEIDNAQQRENPTVSF